MLQWRYDVSFIFSCAMPITKEPQTNIQNKNRNSDITNENAFLIARDIIPVD